MPKSLEIKILERQLKLAELELARIVVATTPMVNELEVSEAFTHKPYHEGPEYLTVLSSIWKPPILTLEDGTVLKTLDEARAIAKKRGLKGISIRRKGS
jgi:hypothetical protein